VSFDVHATLKPRLHDTTGCQTGCQTWQPCWTNSTVRSTGCQTVFVKPVWQPVVWQQVVSCKRDFYGDRCFAAAGPRLWNSLPAELRQCDSLGQFKRCYL